MGGQPVGHVLLGSRYFVAGFRPANRALKRKGEVFEHFRRQGRPAGDKHLLFRELLIDGDREPALPPQ
jgi:hypothetical protein